MKRVVKYEFSVGIICLSDSFFYNFLSNRKLEFCGNSSWRVTADMIIAESACGIPAGQRNRNPRNEVERVKGIEPSQPAWNAD